MIHKYEELILTTPEITQDEMSELEKLFDKKVQEYKGKLVSFDKWGKYQLAYPVNGNEYGVYFLVRFELPQEVAPAAMKEVKGLLELKFNACVMRHIASLLPDDVSATYRRPQSLEETPRDVEFMKEGRGGYRDRDGREPRYSREPRFSHESARTQTPAQQQTEVAQPSTQEGEAHGQES